MWEDIAILSRYMLMLSFNNCLDVARHLPYLFHMITFLVCTGSLSMRASTHGLVINIIHSLCTLTQPHFTAETQRKLHQALNEYSLPKCYKTFGISKVKSATVTAFRSSYRHPSDRWFSCERGGVCSTSGTETNTDREALSLRSLEEFTDSLLDIVLTCERDSSECATWRDTWVALAKSFAFSYNPALQPRALIVFGCISKSVTDQDIKQLLRILVKALESFTDIVLIEALVFCLTRLQPLLRPESPIHRALFWVGISVLQLDEASLFEAGLALLEENLFALDAQGTFDKKSLKEVMMETREPLEWHFKQLDHAVGLSFKSNFHFALVGHLIKGFRHPNPTTVGRTTRVLTLLLNVIAKPLRKDMYEVSPESVAYLSALVSVSEDVRSRCHVKHSITKWPQVFGSIESVEQNTLAYYMGYPHEGHSNPSQNDLISLTSMKRKNDLQSAEKDDSSLNEATGDSTIIQNSSSCTWSIDYMHQHNLANNEDQHSNNTLRSSKSRNNIDSSKNAGDYDYPATEWCDPCGMCIGEHNMPPPQTEPHELLAPVTVYHPPCCPKSFAPSYELLCDNAQQSQQQPQQQQQPPADDAVSINNGCSGSRMSVSWDSNVLLDPEILTNLSTQALVLTVLATLVKYTSDPNESRVLYQYLAEGSIVFPKVFPVIQSLLDGKISTALSAASDPLLLHSVQSIVRNAVAASSSDEPPAEQLQLHFLQSCGFGGLWRFAGPFNKYHVNGESCELFVNCLEAMVELCLPVDDNLPDRSLQQSHLHMPRSLSRASTALLESSSERDSDTSLDLRVSSICGGSQSRLSMSRRASCTDHSSLFDFAVSGENLASFSAETERGRPCAAPNCIRRRADTNE